MTPPQNQPLLYAADLGYDENGGKEVTVTVDRITEPGVITRENGQPTTGYVAHFKGAKKALELCKTNAAFIRLACGVPLTAPLGDVVGQQVTLTVRFIDGIGGVQGPAIRVKVPNGAMIPFKFQNAKCVGRKTPKK